MQLECCKPVSVQEPVASGWYKVTWHFGHVVVDMCEFQLVISNRAGGSRGRTRTISQNQSTVDMDRSSLSNRRDN